MASSRAFRTISIFPLVVVGFWVGCDNGTRRVAEDRRRSTLTAEQRTEEDRAKISEAAEEGRRAELDRRKLRASTLSEEYVRKFLRFPHDAAFPFWGVPDVRSNAAGDIFFVAGTVKAKNAFGAALTYEWGTILGCRDDRWSLLACNVGDDVHYESPELADLVREREAKQIQEFEAAREERKIAAKAANQAAWEAASPVRAWRDASGRFSVEARYGGIIGGKVILRKADGTRTQIPLDRLSEEDRAWIDARKKRRP